MRRWVPMVALSVLLVAATTGCGSGGDAAAPPLSTAAAAPATTVAASTSVPVTTGAPSTTARVGAATTTTREPAATAVIEPDNVAGIALGSTKSQAIAVLGPPTTTGQDTDLGGKKYDFLRWQLGGGGIRGLTLNFRTDSVTSPLLTDWTATATGPATRAGVQVGDPAARVVAAYGPLDPFCCETRAVGVSQGGGRMIVVVDNATQKVRTITGGDPAFWSRSIAD